MLSKKAVSLWQGQKDSKLLRNPSCGARKNLRTAAFPRFFRPLRQPLLAVSATGGARRRCPARSACPGFPGFRKTQKASASCGDLLCLAGAEGLEPSARGFGVDVNWCKLACVSA